MTITELVSLPTVPAAVVPETKEPETAADAVQTEVSGNNNVVISSQQPSLPMINAEFIQQFQNALHSITGMPTELELTSKVVRFDCLYFFFFLITYSFILFVSRILSRVNRSKGPHSTGRVSAFAAAVVDASDASCCPAEQQSCPSCNGT